MTDKMEQVAYEVFCDTSYYDMWCVRPVDERQFGRGFHLINGDEAKALAQMLSNHADQVKELTDRATTAEAALAKARKVIEPFSDMAGELFARNWNNSDVVIAFNTPNNPRRITFKDFCNARQWLQANKGGA
jgi:prophage DNA circulation protein